MWAYRDIRLCGCAAAMILLTLCYWSVPADAAAKTLSERPNVLLIVTDQQHAGMMSCAGNPYVKTPALDALAVRGVRFERAYCGNPVCVPSRFCMMSGLLPSQIGMESNSPNALPVTEEILDQSLGRVFQKAGYQTVFGGKVHLPVPKGMGVSAYGFTRLTDDEREGLARACVDFFRQDHQQPFLLVASFINPHDICMMAIDAYTKPNNLPVKYPQLVRERECLAEAMRPPAGVSQAEFRARICPPLPTNFELQQDEPSAARELSDFRQYVRKRWSEEQWRLHRWAYARLTERVDAEISVVLDGLRAAGLEQGTVVVVTSDHGDMDAAHRLEHKSMPYEEAVRVPMIVSLPGTTAAGLVDKTHLVSTGLDLIPTLCEFAGIATPPGRAGRSVKPLAVKPNDPHGWRETLVIENQGSRVLCDKRFKYALYDHGDPREMLVDLHADPGEMKNLAIDPQHGQTLARYRRLLQKWYEENGEKLDARFVLQPDAADGS